MKDLIVAILALVVTGFIQSCTGPTSEPSQTVDKTSVAKDIVNNVDSVPIPDLYKGMAESQANKLGGLKVGEQAPNIIGTTSDGKPFNLNDAVKSGPVAVVFYRGFWCGICTKHLNALEGEMAELKERGLQVYAITPETDEYIDKTIEKTESNIPFIHDDAHKIMDDYKVTYQVTDDYEAKVGEYAKVGLAKSQGASDAYLPVPATYMIGPDGKIFFAHYDHNYGNRATAADMLKALNTI